YRNVMPDDLNTGPVIAQVVKEKNIRKVAVIVDVKDPVSKYMGSFFWPVLFDKVGVENLTKSDPVTFQSGDPSVTAQVSKLKALNPDAVVLAASPGDAAKIAIEIRRQGMKQQLLGSGALFGDEFLKSGGNAVEGAITAAQFWRDNPDPKVHGYVMSLEKRTGEPPVLGTLDLLTFAHGETIMLSAYAGLMALLAVGSNAGGSLPLALAVAVATGALLGGAVYLGSFRYVSKKYWTAPALSTVGIALI